MSKLYVVGINNYMAAESDPKLKPIEFTKQFPRIFTKLVQEKNLNSQKSEKKNDDTYETKIKNKFFTIKTKLETHVNNLKTINDSNYAQRLQTFISALHVKHAAITLIIVFTALEILLRNMLNSNNVLIQNEGNAIIATINTVYVDL